jgi:hypothetical protein
MERKNLPVPVELPSELKELGLKIEQWRGDPCRSRRMPESLWALAVEVAGQHGVCRVARCFSLDYYSLKERMRSGVETVGPQRKATFIQLPNLSSSSSIECSIEIEQPRGSRLRIHVKGTALPDLASTVRAFCGKR